MSFFGFVSLDATIDLTVLARAGDEPTNSSSLPTYRIYGPNGLMTSGTGSASFKDSGSVTGATNASPIVITSASHGLQTGDLVTITGVGGNTAANGTFTATRLTADTYSLGGSTGNGSYTSGGTWNVTGVYEVSVSALASSGYEVNETYVAIFQGVVGGDNWSEMVSFSVI